MRAYKSHHYEEWADHPLPALHGKTPREAMGTAAGRAAVDVLLKDFENHESTTRTAPAMTSVSSDGASACRLEPDSTYRPSRARRRWAAPRAAMIQTSSVS